jgi:uncharacterized protein (UPF0332 family)
MPFDPSTFLEVTNRVVAESDLHSETYFRTAVGRAYYSAHLVAREVLLSEHRITRDLKGKARHGAVIKALNKPGTELAANALDSLMILRQVSDYDLSPAVGIDAVLEARRLASIVMGDLAPAAPSEPPHSTSSYVADGA